MRIAHRYLPWMLSALLGPVAAEGLKPVSAADLWFGPQSHIRLNAAVLPSSSSNLLLGAASGPEGASWPAGAALMGDYYFSGLRIAGQPRTGFRASTGLIVRQSGVSLADVALSGRSAASFGIASPLNNAAAPGDPLSYSFSTVPYLGFGYSGIVEKTGWGYWADVGVVAQSPANALGLGRVISGSQGIDDLVRDLRLSPMIQLGVKYSF